MPSIETNFRQYFPAAEAKYELHQIKEVLERRELFPVEKMWLETLVFNELFLRFGSAYVSAETLTALFWNRFSQELIEVISRIYAKQELILKQSKTDLKLAKGLRIIASLQGFDTFMDNKYLDYLYTQDQMQKGDKYQYERFRTFLKKVSAVLMIPGTSFVLDGIDKDVMLELLNTLIWLRANRNGEEIKW